MDDTHKEKKNIRAIENRSNIEYGRKYLALVLGGPAEREKKSVEAVCSGNFAVPVPALSCGAPVWLSGPSLTENCIVTCKQAGCDPEQLLIDYRALDTLGNFTTLVKEMRRHNFDSVSIVTSIYQMPRALAIAKVVLRSNGIKVGPEVAINPVTGEVKESRLMVFRDTIRAWLWVIFGVDLTLFLVILIHPERMKHQRRRIRKWTHHGKRCYKITPPCDLTPTASSSL
mmetsp:Transcript_25709/g.29366  ORF Transcript_25709/g.29366 Transcript_25709/m.29366 type:complete len:228 (+) Transcript_25709:23-706(+)